MITNTDTIRPGTVAVVGIPFDTNSSFMRGSAQAPVHIRNVIKSGVSNMCSESGIDLASRTDFIGPWNGWGPEFCNIVWYLW